MRDFKTKMNGERRSVNFHSKLVAKDRKVRNLEHVKTFDKELFEKGLRWFEEGLSLDDASEELRNEFNFVNGFEKAKRLKDINDNLRNLGVEWYESGLPLENAPASYVNNAYFIEGYNSSMNNSRK